MLTELRDLIFGFDVFDGMSTQARVKVAAKLIDLINFKTENKDILDEIRFLIRYELKHPSHLTSAYENNSEVKRGVDKILKTLDEQKNVCAHQSSLHPETSLEQKNEASETEASAVAPLQDSEAEEFLPESVIAQDDGSIIFPSDDLCVIKRILVRLFEKFSGIHVSIKKGETTIIPTKTGNAITIYKDANHKIEDVFGKFNNTQEGYASISEKEDGSEPSITLEKAAQQTSDADMAALGLYGSPQSSPIAAQKKTEPEHLQKKEDSHNNNDIAEPESIEEENIHSEPHSEAEDESNNNTESSEPLEQSSLPKRPPGVIDIDVEEDAMTLLNTKKAIAKLYPKGPPGTIEIIPKEDTTESYAFAFALVKYIGGKVFELAKCEGTSVLTKQGKFFIIPRYKDDNLFNKKQGAKEELATVLARLKQVFEDHGVDLKSSEPVHIPTAEEKANAPPPKKEKEKAKKVDKDKAAEILKRIRRIP